MGNKLDQTIIWTPRILTMAFLGFLALFSLDVISPQLSFWQIVVGLLMHNIPVFVLLIVLLVSWKHELVGGVIFILAGILYTAMVLTQALKNSFQWYMLPWILTIAGPAFLIGILFIVGWRKKIIREARLNTH